MRNRRGEGIVRGSGRVTGSEQEKNERDGIEKSHFETAVEQYLKYIVPYMKS